MHPNPGDDPALRDLVETAVAHHRAGRLDEAEALYGQVIAADPGNWRATHNLGVLHLTQKRVAEALPLLASAVALDSTGESWPSYAQALVAAGDYEAADALLAERPADPRALTLRLRVLHAWARSRMQVMDLAGARSRFEAAAALAPGDAGTHGDLGHVNLRLGDPKAAEAALRRALELSPGDAVAMLNLGGALRQQGRDAEAETLYRRVLEINPRSDGAISNLDLLLRRTGRTAEAEALTRALETPAQQANVTVIRANGLMKRGRFDETLEALNEACRLDPGNPDVLFRRALIKLLLGDFESGWADYEVRWDNPVFLRESAAFVLPELIPRLERRPTLGRLAGKRVLLVAEQGIGDQIMFASAVPDLARTAAKVTLVCDPRLVRLFAQAFPAVEVVDPYAGTLGLEAFDAVVPLGSLGSLFRNRASEFPGRPYLGAGPEVSARWAARLGARQGRLRIGVSWRGGAKTTRTAFRSVRLEQLAPVLDLPDCEFVSLQYGDVTAELAAFNAGRTNPIRAFPAQETDDFEDLAGLMANLDLVVSVQTAVVHLAGAIGKECLTLIPHTPEWRYGARGTSLPWYSSVRLYRQPVADDWTPVIAQVADGLRNRLR